MPRATTLGQRGVADVPTDEDRDATVVARELRGGSVVVAGADRLEEALVVLRSVLERRPAERARHLLTKPRDERDEPRPPRHRVQTDVKALARRKLGLAGFGPGHLAVHALERREIFVRQERHGEADSVALEKDPQLVDLLDVIRVELRDAEAAIGKR